MIWSTNTKLGADHMYYKRKCYKAIRSSVKIVWIINNFMTMIERPIDWWLANWFVSSLCKTNLKRSSHWRLSNVDVISGPENCVIHYLAEQKIMSFLQKKILPVVLKTFLAVSYVLRSNLGPFCAPMHLPGSHGPHVHIEQYSGKYWDYIVVSLIVLILEFVSFMRDRHYISPDLYH